MRALLHVNADFGTSDVWFDQQRKADIDLVIIVKLIGMNSQHIEINWEYDSASVC